MRKENGTHFCFPVIVLPVRLLSFAYCVFFVVCLLCSSRMSSISISLQRTDLGIVFALAIEAGCFVDTLSQVRVTRGDGFIARQGRRGNREIVLVESGPGGHRAAKAAQAMIDAYRPRLVVSAGFAGGLDPRAQRQDLVVATSLCNAADGEMRSIRCANAVAG